MSIIIGILIFVAVSALSATYFSFFVFNSFLSKLTLLIGVILGVCGYIQCRQFKTSIDWKKYTFWQWFVVFWFILFTLKAFVWLIFSKYGNLYITCPHNLGDISLHASHINFFAQFQKFWPDSPIITGEKLRYPFGIDLFNSLLVINGMALEQSFVWVGLISSIILCVLFLEWGGSFTLAGYLFNGGFAGFLFFKLWEFKDYQSDLAWKSIPLTMYLTQRGLLYALPVGLLLLISFRNKYFRDDKKNSLPLWIEVLLYSTLPLFHLHTFVFISCLLGIWMILLKNKKEILKLLAFSFLPASHIIYFITDKFSASSVVSFKFGWMMSNYEMNPIAFWIYNFGLVIPLILILAISLISERKSNATYFKFQLNESVAFVLPSVILFILFCNLMLATWDWDNSKLLIWSYFIILPYLWNGLISKWRLSIRSSICYLLFFSGFIGILGGIDPRKNYKLIELWQVRGLEQALKNIPSEKRFVAYPIFNSLPLFSGRKVALGYPGWIWSHGYKNDTVEKKVQSLMLGKSNWKDVAKDLDVDYIFWGKEEIAHYPDSQKPWEKEANLVASGNWGKIYKIE